MDFDPPSQFEGDTLLERISRTYEEAVDAAGNAFDGEALAENEFLRLWAMAWAMAVEDGVAITNRDKHCNAQKDVCEARQEWNRAIAKRKRTVLKAGEMEHRQMAAMSHQRFIREGT